MARPRNILINAFPPGTVTQEQASEALRKSGGDVEKAKKLVQEAASAKPNTATDDDQKLSIATNTEHQENKEESGSTERLPPRSVAFINNLSDRLYCCVWSVEVFEDGYRSEVARALLAKIARHANPILRDRGWRVKRLMESASRKWIGCCTGNGRDDADAASTNIQLNLRVEPNKHCKVFRSFEQIMSVMLHEITHTSIGLEDIHPPAFYELLNEIRREYRAKLENGEVAKETDDYGCNNTFVTSTGQVTTVGQAASSVVTQDGNVPLFASNEDCGATKRRRRRWRGGGKKRSAAKAMGTVALERQQKRRPLLKGAKMIDKRTKVGKAAMEEQASLSARELAARAALARFGGNNDANDKKENEANAVEDSQGELSNGEEIESDSDEDEFIASHKEGCECRSCEWEHMLASFRS